MTRFEKLISSNDDVQNMEINNDVEFFSLLLPDKMEAFLNQTYFDNLINEDMVKYLDFYRENILIKGIEFVKNSKHDETDWQKEFTLKCAKRYTSDMLWIIKKAFDYYGQMELLTDEEN